MHQAQAAPWAAKRFDSFDVVEEEPYSYLEDYRHFPVFIVGMSLLQAGEGRRADDLRNPTYPTVPKSRGSLSPLP